MSQPSAYAPRSVPPGWYPDPWAPGTAITRWWDGQQWTPHAAPGAPVFTGRSPQGLPLANQGLRLLARVIDGFIGIALCLVPLALIGLVMFRSFFTNLPESDGLSAGEYDEQMTALQDQYVGRFFAFVALLFVVLVVVPLLYEAVLTSRYGQTVGKRLTHLRVVRLSDGRPPSFKAALGRALLFSLMHNLYIDGLWCLWDKPWQQCIHDKPVSTTVVAV